MLLRRELLPWPRRSNAYRPNLMADSPSVLDALATVGNLVTDQFRGPGRSNHRPIQLLVRPSTIASCAYEAGSLDECGEADPQEHVRGASPDDPRKSRHNGRRPRPFSA